MKMVKALYEIMQNLPALDLDEYFQFRDTLLSLYLFNFSNYLN